MNKIGILSAGPGLAEIVKIYGHSSEWIPQILLNYNIQFDVIKVYEDDCIIDDNYDGYIITGSKYSVYDNIKWIDKLKYDLLSIIEREKPMLGICFGHQLLAEVLGGNVCKNSKGWELGSYRVQLTKEGIDSPLFNGLSSNEIFYESHQDVVESPPLNSTVLANSAKGNQSFVMNKNIYGVQFHPEFNWDITRKLMDIRIKKGIEVDSKILLESSNGHLVLNNFIDTIEREKI